MGQHRVRRTPFWEKIRAFPLDTMLWLHEQQLTIDWDGYAKPLALPLGVVLSAFFYAAAVARYDHRAMQEFYRGALFSPNQKVYERVRMRAVSGRVLEPLDGAIGSQRSWLGVALVAANAVLVAVALASIANFVSLYFLSYRPYTLLYQNGPSPLPSARRLHLTNVSGSWWAKLSGFFVSSDELADSDLDSSLVDESQNDMNLFQKDVWQLQVWDPPRFALMLACTLSPPVLVVLYAGTLLPLYSLAASYLALSAATYLTVARFQLLVADKQLLYQEMFQEYNKKFVHPKTSVLRKDAVIDATLGPRILADYTVQTEPVAHLYTAKLKVFITHDIHGKAHNTAPRSALSRLASPAREDVFPRLELYRRENRPLESPFRTPLHPDPRLGHPSNSKAPWYTLLTPFRRNSRNELHTPFRLRPHSPSRATPGRTSPFRLSSQGEVLSRLPSPSRSRPRWH